MPIVEFYKSQNKCKTINALNSIEQVYTDVMEALTGYLWNWPFY